MFDKVKNIYKLQKEAKKIKKELKNIHIEAESNGVIVIVDGEQKVIEVKLPEDVSNKEMLQKDIVEAFNKAVKKSQEVAAEKMRDIMGGLGLNLPGTE